VSLHDRIQSDIAVAMRAGDGLRRDVLRMVVSAAYTIEKKQGRPLTDRDWNDLVALLDRRIQAGALDASGQTFVSSATLDAGRVCRTDRIGSWLTRRSCWTAPSGWAAGCSIRSRPPTSSSSAA